MGLKRKETESMDFEEDEVAVAEQVELPVYASVILVEEGEEDVQKKTGLVPEVVKNFITYFYSMFNERSVWELHSIYENSFNKLTEKYYQKQPWPEAEVIADLVDNDQIFLTFYKELYYRHLYAKLQPTLEDREASYQNYCELFNYILNTPIDEPVDLELPNQWLWDIIDEFIYQFQSFCHYRSKLKSRTEYEISILKERDDVWNIHAVLNVLYCLVQKSRINEQLLASKQGVEISDAAGEVGSRPLYRMLGYFSIIGLVRVHCLLGDYELALKTMENVDLVKKGLFARVTACHVTTYYYVGFAYMMMRRYSDAIKAFCHILLFVSRTKQYHSKSYQFEAIARTTDKMYALLSMCVALSPQRVDENVHNLMREKHGDQLIRMQRGGEDAIVIFDELFNFACPKFISAIPPDYDLTINVSNESARYQLKIFLSEVRQQLQVPIVRSFLKLYTTLDVQKLATFLELDPEELRTQLMVFKHKTRQRRWESGSILEGNYHSTSDLDFYMDRDMIHISENKPGRRWGDWFIRHINKFEDIAGNMKKV